MVEERKAPGMVDTDPHTFTYEVNLAVIKVAYPYPPKNVAYSPLFTPCLSTDGGKYTNIPGYLVTERVSRLITFCRDN